MIVEGGASLLLSIVLLLVLAKLFGEAFERIGMPSLIGELLAGIILGGSLLGIVNPTTIEGLASLGIILLLFLVGFNFDMNKMKTAGKPAFFFTIFGFLFVFIPTWIIFAKIGYTWVHAVFFALVMGGESTPNAIKVVIDLKRLKSRVADVMISSSVIEDFVFYTILALTVALVGAESVLDYGIGIGKILAFFLIFLLMEWFSPRIIKYTERLRVEEAQFAMGFVLIILLAYLAEALGFASIVGAFFAGIALAYSPYLKTGSFSSKISSFTYGVFSPLFFAWMGSTINPSMIKVNATIAILIAVGVAWKFCGNVIGCITGGLPVKKSFGVGIGMLTKGGEQLVILVIASQVLGPAGAGFINGIMIPVMILSMIITIFLGPLFLKMYFKHDDDGLEKNIN